MQRLRFTAACQLGIWILFATSFLLGCTEAYMDTMDSPLLPIDGENRGSGLDSDTMEPEDELVYSDTENDPGADEGANTDSDAFIGIEQEGPVDAGAPNVVDNSNNAIDPFPSYRPSPISVMTYNLRGDYPEDIAKNRGWIARRELILRLIKEQKPDILSVQELAYTNDMSAEKSIEWLREKLAKGFSSKRTKKYRVVKGCGGSPKDIYLDSRQFTVEFPAEDIRERHANVNRSRFGGCFENSQDMECLPKLTNSFYLPPDERSTCEITSLFEPGNPDRLKIGDTPPGVARSATWAIVKDKLTGRRFFVINAHVVHNQATSIATQLRYEQLKCLREKIKQYSQGLPVVVVGDFNFTEKRDNYRDMILGFAQDQHRLYDTHNEPGYGSVNSFCDDCDPKVKIDFIFSYGFRVVEPSITIERKYNGRWPSDHCPVQVWLDFEPDPYYVESPGAQSL